MTHAPQNHTMSGEATPLTSTTMHAIGDGGCIPPGGYDELHTSHCNCYEGTSAQEGGKVSKLEEFSDLVIVVAVHIVASPIERSEADMGWYLIRVFMLWFVWLMATLFMNTATVFRRTNCPTHYMFCFTWMAFVLAMTQKFASSNHSTAILLYLALRAIETGAYFQQVSAPRPGFVTQDRYENMKALVPIMVLTFVVTEAFPLTVAIFFQDHSSGEPYFPAILAAVGSIVLSFFLFAWSSDEQSGGKMMEEAFDTGHLQERCDLIMIIFIGEICFAAGRPTGNDEDKTMVSLASLMSAIGAFLLVFTASSTGRTEFSVRSVKHIVFGIFMYGGLFCAIPAIGSGFVRVMEREEDASRHESCNFASADLLCYATGAFLIFLSFINVMNAEAATVLSEAEVGIWGRFLIRFVCGVVTVSCSLLGDGMRCADKVPTPIFLCPLLMLTSALIEIWAVGSLQFAVSEATLDCFRRFRSQTEIAVI